MRRRKRETTNANAVHGNAFVNGIFGYLHRVLMKPLFTYVYWLGSLVSKTILIIWLGFLCAI